MPIADKYGNSDSHRPVVRACLLLTVLFVGLYANAAKVEQYTLDFDGQKRTYFLYVPKRTPDKPAPLILLFHGSGRDGRFMCERWQSVADKHGIVLVAPNSWNPQTWGFASDPPRYMEALLDEVSRKVPIDRRRMYLFGHSAGAHFALGMSLVESRYFAATAVFAGALVPGWLEFAKTARRKIPIAMFQGSNDPLVPAAEARSTASRLREAGFSVDFKAMPFVGHPYLPVASDVNHWSWEFFEKHRLPDDPEFTGDSLTGLPDELGPPPPGARPLATPTSDEDCARISQGHPVNAPVSAACTFANQLRTSLPNFRCDQVTTRTRVVMLGGRAMRKMDTITAQVAYEDGFAAYSEIRINNVPAKSTMEEIPGMTTWGEFGEQFLGFFRLENQPVFEFREEKKLGPALALAFDFHVDATKNHFWVLEDKAQRLYPAVSGTLWIDKETNRLLRVEMKGLDDPKFSIRDARTSADYKEVSIEGLGKYVVPVRSETSICFVTGSDCVTSEIEFRRFRKFAGKARIITEPLD